MRPNPIVPIKPSALCLAYSKSVQENLDDDLLMIDIHIIPFLIYKQSRRFTIWCLMWGLTHTKYVLTENCDSCIALQKCGLGLLDHCFSKCRLGTTSLRKILSVCRGLDPT